VIFSYDEPDFFTIVIPEGGDYQGGAHPKERFVIATAEEVHIRGRSSSFSSSSSSLLQSASSSSTSSSSSPSSAAAVAGGNPGVKVYSLKKAMKDGVLIIEDFDWIRDILDLSDYSFLQSKGSLTFQNIPSCCLVYTIEETNQQIRLLSIKKEDLMNDHNFYFQSQRTGNDGSSLSSSTTTTSSFDLPVIIPLCALMVLSAMAFLFGCAYADLEKETRERKAPRAPTDSNNNNAEHEEEDANLNELARQQQREKEEIDCPRPNDVLVIRSLPSFVLGSLSNHHPLPHDVENPRQEDSDSSHSSLHSIPQSAVYSKSLPSRSSSSSDNPEKDNPSSKSSDSSSNYSSTDDNEDFSSLNSSSSFSEVSL
jgi:hypothetical protein